MSGRLQLATLMAMALALSAQACSPSAAGPHPSSGALVVTQTPADQPWGTPAERLLPSQRYPAGSRVVLVKDRQQPHQVRVLSRGMDRAGAPALAADGRHILFTGPHSTGTGWTIYESGIEGPRPRQILHIEHDCIDPAYMAGNRIIFTCAPQGPEPRVWSLHTASGNGTDLRRLTFGPGSAFDPTPLADGRVLFTMLQGAGPGRPEAATALFTINADGTMLEAFTGSHRPPAWKVRPRQTADGGVIFLSAGTGDGTARVQRVEMSFPGDAGLTMTAAVVLAAEPTAAGDTLIAARKPGASPGDSGLFMLSRDGDLALLLDDPEYHEVEGLLVEARERSPRRPSAVAAAGQPGTLVCYDTGRSDGIHGGPGRPPQRMMAEVLQRADTPSATPATLGQVPLASDGSFHIEVPADQPLRLLADYGDGTQVVSHWFWLRPGEVRTCFGCHESRTTAPPNRPVQALASEPVSLTSPAPSPARAAR